MRDELTPREVAEELGVTVRTVQRWIAGGRLPGTRVGGRMR
ncbi:MAG: helix-turn-helix domain-containing protein, partial [Candidatus Limnocylindria bacterium]